MKIVIYRNKATNQIGHFHGVNERCTEENMKAYNSDERHTDTVEIVELEENSLAYYFYNLKIKQIQDEAEDLRNIMDDIQDIANRIDDRLYDFDRWFEEEKREVQA